MQGEKIRFWFENPSYPSKVSQLPISGIVVLSATQFFIGSAIQAENDSAGRIALVRVDTSDNYQIDVQLLSYVSYGTGEWRNNIPLPNEQHHQAVNCVSGTYSTTIDAPDVLSGSFFYSKVVQP